MQSFDGPGGESTRPGYVPTIGPSVWCVDVDERGPNLPPLVGSFLSRPEGASEAFVQAHPLPNSFTYRLVWQPRPGKEWWIPNGGLQFSFQYSSTEIYGVFAQSRTAFQFVMTAEISPEFLDILTYPSE